MKENELPYYGVGPYYCGSIIIVTIASIVLSYLNIIPKYSISGLGLNPSKEEIGELALLATANGTMKLSRIRPLDTDDAKKIFEMAR